MKRFAMLGWAALATTLCAWAEDAQREEAVVGAQEEVLVPTAVYDGQGNVLPQGPGLRTVVTGYRNWPATGETTFRSGPLPRRAMDDLLTVCGPAEIATGSFTLTSMQFGLSLTANVLTPLSFDAVIIFFDNLDQSSTATSPINTVELGRVRVSFTNVLGDGVSHFYVVNPIDLTGISPPIVFDDNDNAIDIQFVPTGGVVPPGGIGTVTIAQEVTHVFFGSRVPEIGDSTDTYWRDSNANGMYDVADARTFTGPNNIANFRLILDGDFVGTNPPAPVRPTTTCLGALIDDDVASPPGPIAISSPLAAGEVKWYEFTLTQDVVASASGVPSSDTLDFHTDGSSLTGTAPTDTVLSIYKPDGSLYRWNDDAPAGPTGTNYSAISFGDNLPRASANLILMAGEDGAINKGNYLVALSAFPVQVIRCGWRHTSLSTETGSVVLNVMANLNNGCAGDLNGDRVVNESDLGILLGSWQSNACGDVNRDGASAESDLGVVLANWQVTCP
ncbi:MAG: hypothetical protein U1D55_11295 [Phycisphaerae bacterium]